MATSTSPKIAAANIPSITSLRNELDYGDLRLPRCAAFCDDTRAFRKKFITSHGVPGTDLYDWRSREGQAGLTEMTLAYLDKEGNGPMFWPDDKSSSMYNKYQYSKDHARIRRLVKQLFFRLNQQQFRNKKYKNKDTPHSRLLDRRGHSPQTAIDVDALEQEQPLSTTASKPPLANVSAGAEADANRPYVGERSCQDRSYLDHTDIYAVPLSPPMRPFQPVNQPSRGKRNPPLADSSSRSRQPKRQRRQPRPSVTDDGASTTDAAGGPIRSSPRAKRTVYREGYHGLDVMNELIDSEEAQDALRDTLAPPQPASSPVVSTITVRAPADDIDGPANPEDSVPCSEDQHELAPVPAPEPHPSPQLNLESENSLVHDQTRLEARDVAPAPSETGDLKDREEKSEQTKMPPLGASASPTPGPAGGAVGGGPGVGGGETKFSITFIYRLVLTRTPRTVTERWTPQGRFQDKTLAELLKELPFPEGESRGLIFTIESSCMKTVERVLNDDEDGFASMKRYITMEIREWLARQRRQGIQNTPRLVIDIMIERMSGDSKREVDVLEDLKLEW